MSTPIRVGLIGFGVAGRVFHAPLLRALPDQYALRAIVTRDEARRAEALASTPGVIVVPTVEALLALHDELDLVVIASPGHLHAEHARAAIDAGLSVVVDKPVAITSREARDMHGRAAERGVQLTVFQNRRWDGDFIALRNELASGRLGDPQRFESHFEWWKPERNESWKSRTPATQGGGLLYDLGAHLIDQALLLFGDAEVEYADLARRAEWRSAEDDATIVLRHTNGVRSQLWMSSVAASFAPRFRVLGSAASFEVYGLDPQESQLAAGLSPTSSGFGERGRGEEPTVGTPDARHAVESRGRYLDFYRELATSLTDGGELPVNVKDSIRVLELIENAHALAIGAPAATA